MGYVLNKVHTFVNQQGADLCEMMPSVGFEAFVIDGNLPLVQVCKTLISAIIAVLFDLTQGPVLQTLRAVLDIQIEFSPGTPMTVLTDVPEAANDNVNGDEEYAEDCEGFTAGDCEWIQRRKTELLSPVNVEELKKRVNDGYVAVFKHDHRIKSESLKEYVEHLKGDKILFHKYLII